MFVKLAVPGSLTNTPDTPTLRLMDKLSPESIAAGLGTRWLARPDRIYYYERTGSTNDEARRLALAGAPEGTLVIAEEQTAGRGRLGRRWLAPAGEALLFSILFLPPLAAHEAYPLTMVASLACLHAVEAETGLHPTLKWPNDLLLKGKKLAGMLSELGQVDDRLYCIIGIGLNVNVDFAAAPELRTQATSLRLSLSHPVPRLPLLQAILRRIEAGYDALRAGHSPYPAWVTHLGTLGQAVRVTTSEGSFAGVATSADPDGALYITLPDGSMRRILTGDVQGLRPFVETQGNS